MGIELNHNASAIDQLQQIARMAYGSREGKEGGAGNIGMIGNHVVKYNTHYSERGGRVTADMAHSANALREVIRNLVANALDARGIAGPDADQLKASVAYLMGPDYVIGKPSAKHLLDRRVVAQVVNLTQNALNKVVDEKMEAVDLWYEVDVVDSSKGVRTDFASAFMRTKALSGAQVKAQQLLAEYGDFAKDLDGAAVVVAGANSREFIQSNDRTGDFFRSAQHIRANQETRAEFAAALCTLCDVDSLDKLPENVRKELKIDDFADNKGHPLTAGRIRRILAEVAKTDNWKRTALSTPEELQAIRERPFDILQTTRPVVYNYNAAHLEDMRHKLETDTSGNINQVAMDVDRVMHISVNGVPFDGPRDRSLQASADTKYKDSILAALGKAFINPDKTVNEKALNAFVRICEQGIVSDIHQTFDMQNPEGEWPAVPGAMSGSQKKNWGLDISSTSEPGVYRVRLNDRRDGFDKIYSQDYVHNVDIDKSANNSCIEHTVEFTFTVDENGSLHVKDIPLARCMVDFSQRV